MKHQRLLALSLTCLLCAPSFSVAQNAATAAAPATVSKSTATRQTVAASAKDFARARKAANAITAAQLRKDLTYIASDELGGRDTPSDGLDKAADFIAARMRTIKARPAGDNNSYFQQIELRRTTVDESRITAALDNQALTYGTDFVTATTGGTATGTIIFVNHGWVVPSKNINAYRNVDVRDKIMFVIGGLPAGVTPQELQAGKRGVDYTDPATYAQANGARGIVLLARTPNLSQYFDGRRRIAARGATVVRKFEDATNPAPNVPTLFASQALAQRMLGDADANTTAALAAFEKPIEVAAFETNKTLSFNVAAKTESVMTKNVIAVIEGTDKVLKNEYVALGAHYDHVGTNPNAEGADKIWNGADDDGSGTTALMAIAEAFAKSRPRRSVLFVWHTGEEKGLWGSRYFVENPTVDVSKIVAQLNIDMIGRSRAANDTNPKNKDLTATDEVYVIGSRMMSDALGELNERVNRNYLNVKYNYRYDDVNDRNRFFYRSDHYNYAIKDIPIVFYFNGVHEDYHQPGDEVSKIDFPKMERISRTVFMTASELANASERPRVDRPLPANVRR